MEYKISELVHKTKISKSTILYYIREGLLPKANQIKSNVHKYNDEHIELINYITYMKEHFNTGNEQLKGILKNKNQSFHSSSSMITPLMNTLSAISSDEKHYSKKEFIAFFDVDEPLLDRLLEDEILMPLEEDAFTQKEVSIIKLVQVFYELDMDYDILKHYVFHAKALSLLEDKMQRHLCDIRNDKNFSTLWKVVFETLFNAKTYIFNRHTYRTFFSTLKSELLK